MSTGSMTMEELLALPDDGIDRELIQGVEEVPALVGFKTLQRYGASDRIVHQSFQLVPAMRRHRDIGMQRKPVHAGTAGAGEGPGVSPPNPELCSLARKSGTYLLTDHLGKPLQGDKTLFIARRAFFFDEATKNEYN